MNPKKQHKLAYILLPLFLGLSPLASGKTFFMSEPEQTDSYYSNDDVRSEKILKNDVENFRSFSKKHQLVTQYLNSANDPIATDARWDSENILRIGVVRRSLASEEYAGRVCRLVSAAKLDPGNIKVRVIHLPSLVVHQKLDMLVDYNCSLSSIENSEKRS